MYCFILLLHVPLQSCARSALHGGIILMPKSELLPDVIELSFRPVLVPLNLSKPLYHPAPSMSCSPRNVRRIGIHRVISINQTLSCSRVRSPLLLLLPPTCERSQSSHKFRTFLLVKCLTDDFQTRSSSTGAPPCFSLREALSALLDWASVGRDQ